MRSLFASRASELLPLMACTTHCEGAVSIKRILPRYISNFAAENGFWVSCLDCHVTEFAVVSGP